MKYKALRYRQPVCFYLPGLPKTPIGTPAALHLVNDLTHTSKQTFLLETFTMTQLINALYNDEAGFIVSAELVLVATIAVLGMVVGLSEVAFNVNQELEDVGSAFGSINQNFHYNGTAGHKGGIAGSKYNDEWDQCDDSCDVSCDVAPTGESY